MHCCHIHPGNGLLHPAWRCLVVQLDHFLHCHNFDKYFWTMFGIDWTQLRWWQKHRPKWTRQRIRISFWIWKEKNLTVTHHHIAKKRLTLKARSINLTFVRTSNVIQIKTESRWVVEAELSTEKKSNSIHVTESTKPI